MTRRISLSISFVGLMFAASNAFATPGNHGRAPHPIGEMFSAERYSAIRANAEHGMFRSSRFLQTTLLGLRRERDRIPNTDPQARNRANTGITFVEGMENLAREIENLIVERQGRRGTERAEKDVEIAEKERLLREKETEFARRSQAGDFGPVFSTTSLAELVTSASDTILASVAPTTVGGRRTLAPVFQPVVSRINRMTERLGSVGTTLRVQLMGALEAYATRHSTHRRPPNMGYLTRLFNEIEDYLSGMEQHSSLAVATQTTTTSEVGVDLGPDVTPTTTTPISTSTPRLSIYNPENLATISTVIANHLQTPNQTRDGHDTREAAENLIAFLHGLTHPTTVQPTSTTSTTSTLPTANERLMLGLTNLVRFRNSARNEIVEAMRANTPSLRGKSMAEVDTMMLDPNNEVGQTIRRRIGERLRRLVLERTGIRVDPARAHEAESPCNCPGLEGLCAA